MILGKYGEMILTNLEKNYPFRKQELELTGELEKVYSYYRENMNIDIDDFD